MSRRISNVIGFDDSPFTHNYRGPVKVVGTVYARLHLNGVLIGEVQKDGVNAAQQLTRLVAESKFMEHAQLIMLQGIALGGFNVVDVFYMHAQLALPILVVSRHLPNQVAVKEALLTQVPQGAQKWAIIERLGPMEEAHKVYVQRVGLSLETARTVIKHFAIQGNIPEPLRTAHLIGGALVDGQSRGRT